MRTVSCVVRFHDSQNLPCLERAVHSLHSQTDVSVKTIVVLQRFSESAASEVVRMLARNWYFPEHQAPAVINYETSNSADARSHLMNLGIRLHLDSGSRSLGFLDYDDFLYSHAYSILTAALTDKKVAITFVSVEVGNAIPLKDYDFIYKMTRTFAGKNKIDLLRDNFCPLHSYLLNTEAIDSELIFFREDMSRVEDYVFLIRVAGASPCDFSNIGNCIGCY